MTAAREIQMRFALEQFYAVALLALHIKTN